MTHNRTILLAGESWSTTSVHTKGFDTFHTTSYEEGAWPFIRSLEKRGWTVEFQPNHVASLDFPYTAAELDKYDVVVLSDIGANTLLLTQSVFTQGKPATSNRLRVLAEWVRAGGALLMVGGYLSFQESRRKPTTDQRRSRMSFPCSWRLAMIARRCRRVFILYPPGRTTSRLAWPANGQQFSDTSGSRLVRAPRSSRRPAITRSSWWGRPARDESPQSPPIWARTGFPPTSSHGTATDSCGIS